MKVEISIPEVISIFKEIQGQPEKRFTMIRSDTGDSVGQVAVEVPRDRKGEFETRKNSAQRKYSAYRDSETFILKSEGEAGGMSLFDTSLAPMSGGVVEPGFK